MIAMLLLQAAPLLAPLHLGDAPPPVRCARHILLAPRPSEDEAGRSAAWKELEEEAASIRRRLDAGADFGAEAALHSDAPDAKSGACFGALPPGVLNPAFEEFLWKARTGEVSGIIRTDTGLHILQRVPERVGVRLVLVDLDDRARAADAARRLAAGEEFAAVARACCSDAKLGERGGMYAVYERGPRDTLLKQLAFESPPMSVSAPQQLPVGIAWLRSEDPAGWPAELVEPTFVRLRALHVAHEGARAQPPGARAQPEAKRFIDELRERARQGADFARLCAAYTDEPGGRERSGDLGWVHREQPACPQPLTMSFGLPVGGLSEVMSDARGFWIVKRER